MLLTLGIGQVWAEEYALYSGTITEGDYVIVYDGNAMNNTVSSSRLGYTAVTITGDKISNPPATIVWHIAPSGGYWTIFSANVNKYAASTGAKNKAQLLASGTDDKSLWTVSSSSTYEFVNKANAAANVNKNLRRNGEYGFACYATSTGGALSLYKKVEQSGGGETTEPVIVKTLKSIAVTGMKTTYEQGDIFKFDGTCTATYSVTKDGVAQADETAEVTPTSVSAPDMNQIGTQTITVTYETVSTTYGITITENEVTAGTYNVLLNNKLWNVTAGQQVASVESMTGKSNDITFYTTKGSSQMYASATQTRFYNGATFVISVPNGYVIKSIVFTEPTSDKKWEGSISANVGTYDSGTKSWSGNAQEVIFSFAAQNRIANASITFEAIDMTIPSAPTFNPEAGTYNAVQNVTISAEAGTTIYYTLDGTDPTTASNVYASAIEIAETKTLKAIAVKDEKVSPVATATYTINLPLTTMDQIFEKATAVGGTATPVEITFDNWVVTGIKSSNAYVTDGTKGFIIYNASHGFVVGDVLSGTVTCKVQLYKGSAELTELTSSTSGLNVTKDGVVNVVELDADGITALTGVNTGSVIKITGPCTVDGTNYYIAGLQLFNSLFAYTNPEEGYNYECTGVYLQYSTTKEILPRKAEDLVKIVTQQPAGIKFETTEYTANVNEAFTAPTLTNPNSLTVTYSTSDATLATVNATTGAVTILNKTGKVTITASFAGDEDYVAATASYNITISDPSISEATFVAGTDLSDEKSISKNGVTVEFTDGVFNRADNYRCYGSQKMTISYANGQITKIVFTCTGSGTSDYGPGKFTTESGYTYDAKVGTWVGSAKSVTFAASAQVRMTEITVYYKEDTRTAAGLEWSSETINLTVGDAFTAPSLSNPNGLTLTCTSDNEDLATVTNAGVITLKEGVTGKAVITASFEGNATYKDATVTCTITVSPKSEKVVILAQYNGEWYALKAAYLSGKTDRLDAIPVNYVGGKLYNVAEADKASIEWSSVVEGDKVSFINDGKYLKGKTTTTLLFEEDADGLYQWNSDYTMVLSGSSTVRTFMYNGEAFRNFAVSNAGKVVNEVLYSELPVVTAPVYTTGTLYTIKATAENGTVTGAGVYVAGDKVTLTADPAMDYTFVNWTVGGAEVSTANPFVFEATESLELVANFAEISKTSKTLSGKFSTGEYEYAEFATGNLQYNVKNKEWSFAKQQYQYIGEANINVGNPTFTGTIDMFGWSTDNEGNNYGVNPNNVNNLYDGNFVDWGTKMGEGWSTLSADQWKYLLNTRTNASSLKQIARVGSVVGIMLFPDNWNAPLTVTAQHDSYFDVDIHNYTLAQWTELEKAGAVFLPAAGRRTGGYGNMINYDQETEIREDYLVNGGFYRWQDNTNIYCYYWTSTINEDNKVAYLHNIKDLGNDEYTIGTGAVWGEKGRYGQSVRLAKVTKYYTRDVTPGNLGTICLPFNVPAGKASGATFYTLAGMDANGRVAFDEVTTGELEAGKSYLFQANAAEIVCYYGTTSVLSPDDSGAMKGTFVEKKLTGSDLTNIYYFAQKALWSCVDLTELEVPANRAYVDMEKVDLITGAAPVGVRRITLGVNGQNTATGIENVGATEQPMKMIIDGQLYIIRGEKTYDAQGKLVK